MRHCQHRLLRRQETGKLSPFTTHQKIPARISRR
ncbi:hypothetical protein F383_14244 [Gossypium arboreum]|uniref:Uncharacterized protein n=1 Tax=Gossypium arboreum TaxID=29729 RepID=A0A0B0NC31_GOSAR|nr:hypothetical protein F383_14244 [Gossypium arboreum]